MRIGILSDTHAQGGLETLPAVLRDGLSGLDGIFHAGDVIAPELLDDLTRIAPVTAVAGNLDPQAVLVRWGDDQILELEGWRIGMTHGHLGKGRNAVERSISRFAGRKPDVLIFGHSHRPTLERVHGMLLFNPGSPTQRRREPRYSYGILELLPRTLRATLVFFGP